MSNFVCKTNYESRLYVKARNPSILLGKCPDKSWKIVGRPRLVHLGKVSNKLWKNARRRGVCAKIVQKCAMKKQRPSYLFSHSFQIFRSRSFLEDPGEAGENCSSDCGAIHRTSRIPGLRLQSEFTSLAVFFFRAGTLSSDQACP